MATEKVLFVGGPYDGKEVIFDRELSAVYASLLPAPQAERLQKPLLRAQVEQNIYRLLRLSMGTASRTLYVDSTIDHAAFVDLLLANKDAKKG